MQIADRIRADVTAAMKAGERERVTALRLVLSELQKDAKEGAGDELAVLRRERKKRREAEEAYRAGGRSEQADGGGVRGGDDRGLSAQPSSPTTSSTRWWRPRWPRPGRRSPRDMGRVIKQVMEAAGGRADGKRVSTKVKEALN